VLRSITVILESGLRREFVSVWSNAVPGLPTAHAALRNKRFVMNNTAILALTLLALACLDIFFVAGQKVPESRSAKFYTTGTDVLPPSLEYAPGSETPTTERARRLFQLWGEWRLGRAGARQFVLYDPSAEVARVFPTPLWLDAKADMPKPRL
jgi:hypothetical protein